MIIYIVSLLLTLLFSFTAIVNKNNKKVYIIFALLSMLPLLLVSALRYDVGTDYSFRYAPDYINIANGGNVSNLEILFKTLIKICLLFTCSYQSIFIVTSIFIIVPIFLLIYKKSKYPLISILIFVIGAFYFESLNLVRQYLSMVIILCSYPLLVDKKIVKWLLCVILAAMLHKTSLLAIMLLPLIKKEFFTPKITFLISSAILVLGPLLRKMMILLISFTSYSNYINTIYSKMDIRETIIILNIVVYIIMYLLYRSKKQNDKINQEDILFLNIQGMAVAMCMISIQFSIMYRLVAYLMIFQIISIPNLSNINRKNTKILLLVLLTMYCINFYYLYIKNNYNEVLPYKFCFDVTTVYK